MQPPPKWQSQKKLISSPTFHLPLVTASGGPVQFCSSHHQNFKRPLWSVFYITEGRSKTLLKSRGVDRQFSKVFFRFHRQSLCVFNQRQSDAEDGPHHNLEPRTRPSDFTSHFQFCFCLFVQLQPPPPPPLPSLCRRLATQRGRG